MFSEEKYLYLVYLILGKCRGKKQSYSCNL